MWWQLWGRKQTDPWNLLAARATLLGERENSAWRITARVPLPLHPHTQNNSIVYSLFLGRYDASKGMESLEDTFVSQANALQRKGRAGRVASGVCFHLFTSHHYSHLLLKQQLPEIQRVPLEQLCLRWPLDLHALLPASPNVSRAISVSRSLFPSRRRFAKNRVDELIHCKGSMSQVVLSFPFNFLHIESLTFAKHGPTITLKNTFVS